MPICICIFILLYACTSLVIIFFLGQNYTNLLHTFVKGNVSLDPITASIQEFASAAEEAEEEAMVRQRTLLDILLIETQKFSFMSLFLFVFFLHILRMF